MSNGSHPTQKYWFGARAPEHAVAWFDFYRSVSKEGVLDQKTKRAHCRGLGRSLPGRALHPGSREERPRGRRLQGGGDRGGDGGLEDGLGCSALLNFGLRRDPGRGGGLRIPAASG